MSDNNVVQEEKITAKDIIALLDNRYPLIYVDYRESLDDNLDKVAEAIRTQEWSPVDENIFEWYLDNQDYNVDYILKELVQEVEKEFEISEGEAHDLVFEEYFDEIREAIYDRDDSTPIDDLIRNSQDPVMFYDLGLDVDFNIPFGTEEELKQTLKEIKKALKIKLSETKYDPDLLLMIEQGYCGKLVVYFTADIRDMMKLSDKTHVTFKNPMVAIINTWNGSGDHTDLPGHSFTIPFNIENFFMDKEIKYSYTYEVCGMYSDWCDCTSLVFSKKSGGEKKEKSELHIQADYEKKCNETFKAGKCTPMDMDYKRHRNKTYINDSPCGTKCLDCGTFWID